MASTTPYGLLHALLLDRNGGAKPIEPAGIDSWQPEDGLLWLHLDVSESPPDKWMQTTLGLKPVVIETLNADETRPRSLALVRRQTASVRRFVAPKGFLVALVVMVLTSAAMLIYFRFRKWL